MGWSSSTLCQANSHGLVVRKTTARPTRDTPLPMSLKIRVVTLWEHWQCRMTAKTLPDRSS
ncbi:UNVERIFIED_CONTAM: hypothetical protein GTU68_063223 [Idotea baltica]|nr:hypothetical protein [Idotea baltica]